MERSLNAVLLAFLSSLKYGKLSKALRKSNYHKFEEYVAPKQAQKSTFLKLIEIKINSFFYSY